MRNILVLGKQTEIDNVMVPISCFYRKKCQITAYLDDTQLKTSHLQATPMLKGYIFALGIVGGNVRQRFSKYAQIENA